MKKTQKIDSRRNIRSRLAAFLTLALIIALGLGGFFSSRFTEDSMRASGRIYLNGQRFQDFSLLCSTGITEEDLQSIREISGVEAAEGRWLADAVCTIGQEARSVLALSMTRQVSVPEVIEGRAPESPGECIIDRDLLEDSGASIGDTILLADAGTGFLISGSYVITGSMYHPDYLRRDTVYPVVVSPQAFRAGGYRYVCASVSAEQPAEIDMFSDAYFDGVAGVKSRLIQWAEAATEKAQARKPGLFPEFNIFAGGESNWVVLERNSNAGYCEYRSTIGAVRGSGVFFGLLFLFVAGMQCYSTLSLIVEEQRRQVGMTKAFGFFRREILGKYLFFAVSAALLGAVLGVMLGFGLGRLILFLLEKTELYIFNPRVLRIQPDIVLLLCLAAILFCALVSVLACLDLLRSPAAALMRGQSRRGETRKQTPGRNAGSLYSRLILRNVWRDKGRVLTSIVVVSVSCILIGDAVTVKLAYDGMNARQLSKVYLFDERVDLEPETAEKNRADLENVLNGLDVDWKRAGYDTILFDNNGCLDAAVLLVGKAENLKYIVGMTDPAAGTENIPDDEGILIQYRMAENLSLRPGDHLTLLDQRLSRFRAQISGFVQNYQKRMVVMTQAAYRGLFGKEYAENSYFIRLNGMDDQQFRDILNQAVEDLRFERADSFYDQYRSIAFMYNTVVMSVTVIAILISFVILVNLAAIFMARKKPELIIMLVNGFTLRETIGYIARETVATVAAGLLLGLMAGIPLGGMAVRMMETPDVQFVRDVQPAAWICAVLIEALFAALIYTRSFRQIRNFNIHELSEAQ